MNIVKWWNSKTFIGKMMVVSIALLVASLMMNPKGADNLTQMMECQVLTCVKVIR